MSEESPNKPAENGLYWAQFFGEPWEVAYWNGDEWYRNLMTTASEHRYVKVGVRAVNPIEDPERAILEGLCAILIKNALEQLRLELEKAIKETIGKVNASTIPNDTNRG